MTSQESTATAAASLFRELAGDSLSIAQLFLNLLEKGADHDAICVAGAALANRVGYIAHNAEVALDSCYGGTQSSDEWMLSPSGLQALAVLRANKPQDGVQQ